MYFVGARHSGGYPSVYRGVGGAIFHYEGARHGEAASERLTSLGAPGEPLVLLMLSSRNNDRVEVKYSYVVQKARAKSPHKWMVRTHLNRHEQLKETTGIHPHLEVVAPTRRRLSIAPANVVSMEHDNIERPRNKREHNGWKPFPLLKTAAASSEYAWRVSKDTPCSASCDAGVMSQYVQCYRHDNTHVEEAYCTQAVKPRHLVTPCERRPCRARWVVGSWSKCSVSCSTGVQYRSIRCWQMMARGFDSSVLDHLCDPDARPPGTRPCVQPACRQRWLFTDWTQCSRMCGGGLHRRDVRCLSTPDRDICDVTDKPTSTKTCGSEQCNSTWVVSDWAKCSGSCKSGTRRRSVGCRQHNGNYVDPKYCSGDQRPLAEEPCTTESNATCSERWHVGEWSACSVTCARGQQIRRVVCGVIAGGRYTTITDHRCHHILKPATRQSCRQGRCDPDWYTSLWSKCSQACGSGSVRTRQVECLHGDEPSADCDRRSEPITKESCDLPACANEQSDDNCSDMETVNCKLVFNAKLCSHWYYKTACCYTCVHGNKVRSNQKAAASNDE